MRMYTATLSVLAGVVPYILAFTDIDAVPLRFAASALAVLLAVPCLAGQAVPQAARIVATIGCVLGGVFLASTGLLWLLWPA